MGEKKFETKYKKKTTEICLDVLEVGKNFNRFLLAGLQALLMSTQ